MAKNSVDQWDTTAANNTDVGGISIAEGMAPSDVNNAMREMMAQLKASPAGLLAQTSATDATAGRLLKAGAFGLGAVLQLSTPDLNDATRPNGIYYCSTPTNGPTASNGWLFHRELSASYATQEYVTASDGLIYVRSMLAGVWQPWKRTDDASGLGTGTIPNGRFPATLPTASGANLTNLSASAIPATLTADKAFRRGNVLGTVSQSGGAPTGALIQRGSNANGEYVRFADGTQICSYSGNVNTPISNAYGAAYQGGVFNLTFPASFISSPVVTAGEGQFGTGRSWAVAGKGASTTEGSFYLMDFFSRTADNVFVSYIAIGRWF